MFFRYNRFGRITSEKWYDAADTLTAHYKYVYDDEGNVIRSVDILLGKEYHYSYEDGRIVRSTENDVTLDANGIRIGKVVDGVTHTYQVEGDKILCEQYGTTTITPIYDNEDSICGILYNEEPYFFVKNLQGDIIAITNKNAEVLARYTYDAWGKVLSVTNASGAEITTSDHIAHQNPYRYRSYYYDTETELYYLQSRYYDPVVGRFVNADSILMGLECASVNLYAYCMNDPINDIDATGNAGWKSVFSLFSRIINFMVDAVKICASASNKMDKLRKSLKDAIKRGAPSKYIKELREKQRELFDEKYLGVSGLSGISAALSVLSMIAGLVDMLKSSKDINILSELFVEGMVELLKYLFDEGIAELRRYLPGVFYLLGWAASILLDTFVDLALSSKKVKKIKKDFAKRVKRTKGYNKWLSLFFKSVKACV